MPHESVLDSLASTFNPLVPDWDESDPTSARAPTSVPSTVHSLRQTGSSPRMPPVRSSEAASRPAGRPTSTSWSEGGTTGASSLPPSATRRRCTGTSGTTAGTARPVEPGNRQTDLAMAKETTAGRVFRSAEWVANESDVLGRSWSTGLSVPPSDALGPFALLGLSDGPGAPWSETTLAALDVETRRIVDDAAASAAGVVLANCGVVDAMVATLVNVESLEGGALDRFLAAVAQPERPPMTMVAT